MKRFEEPMIIVEMIHVEDIIVTSELLIPGIGDGNVGGEIFD